MAGGFVGRALCPTSRENLSGINPDLRSAGRSQRRRAGLEAQADAKVVEYERQEREREKPAGLDGEIRVELGQDFVGPVDVLAPRNPGIVAAEVFLVHALGGEFAGQPVGRATLAGDDDEQLAALLVEEAIGLAEAGGQVLQHVDGEVAVHRSLGKIEPRCSVRRRVGGLSRLMSHTINDTRQLDSWRIRRRLCEPN